MSQAKPATLSMDFSNSATRPGTAENLKSGAETELRLSAYTMSRQRPFSQDFQVQEVPPGV